MYIYNIINVHVCIYKERRWIEVLWFALPWEAGASGGSSSVARGERRPAVTSGDFRDGLLFTVWLYINYYEWLTIMKIYLLYRLYYY